MRNLVGLWIACLIVTGCGGSTVTPVGDDADVVATPDVAAPVPEDAGEPKTLGTVVDVRDLPACPNGTPAGAVCRQITVRDCPDIADEPLAATIAILEPQGAVRGTITHLKGGGGEGFLTLGIDDYRAAGFRQVLVSWAADWEQTASHGIKTAGCRPATLLKWIFEDPGLHGADRTLAFCGEGKSGGSGQLGYALAHYGLGDYLDYVNEFAGPPFSRIDLGCDGDAPATATVCGATVTMRLPDKVGPWENATVACGSTNVPASELARWKADSIAVGGNYDYPDTRVEFFDCTHNAPAVAGMSQLYYNEIAQAEADPARVGYHCYSQADGCQGEDLGTGNAVAIQSMLDGCIPRHH